MTSYVSDESSAKLDQVYALGCRTLSQIAAGDEQQAKALLAEAHELLTAVQSCPLTQLSDYVARRLANAIRIYAQARSCDSLPPYDFVRVGHCEAIDVSCCTHRVNTRAAA